MLNRIIGQAREGINRTCCTNVFLQAGQCLLTSAKYCLIPAKLVSNAALTFFGVEYVCSWLSGNPNYSPSSSDIREYQSIVFSVLLTLNNMVFTAGTTCVQMKNQLRSINEVPEAKPDDMESQIIPIPEKSNCYEKGLFTYATINRYLSFFYSSFSTANSFYILCSTILSVINRSTNEEAINSINSDPNKQTLILSLSSMMFFSQLLSYAAWQSKSIVEYLKKWWFNPEVRNKQIKEQGWKNIFWIPGSISVVAGKTFFSTFNTEISLSLINKSFFNPILKFTAPKVSLDIATWCSITSMTTTTTLTSVPSLYDFLSKKNEPIQLSSAGKFIYTSGIIDAISTTMGTTCASISKLSDIFQCSPYNPYLIISSVIFIFIPNLSYNWSYSVRKPIYDLKYGEPINDVTTPLLHPLLQSDHLQRSEGLLRSGFSFFSVNNSDNRVERVISMQSPVLAAQVLQDDEKPGAYNFFAIPSPSQR